MNLSAQINCIEKDGLILNTEFKNLLEKNNIDTYEAIWCIKNGEQVKKIKERSVTRIEIETENNKKRVFYLKRHNRKCLGISRLFAFFLSKNFVSEGRKEFTNICDFRKRNLPTVVPVAAGEKFFRFFWIDSLLLTEDCSPFLPLSDILEIRPDFFKRKGGERKKKILLRGIALLARSMHNKGLNHRDFNSTHILVNYDSGSNMPQFSLFDMQRVDKNKFLSFRWMIKSLARLFYSLPKETFNEKDRIYIFLSYKGKTDLNITDLNIIDKIQWFYINRKTAKIKKHTEKKPERKEI